MNFKTRMITHEVLSGLGFGLFLAVQGIFFLEKGMDLWMIGIISGIIGISAFMFELPFGAAADIHGRIKIFRISVTVITASFIIAVLSSEFWHLIVVAVLMGLGIALRSGSIDAWVVEQINEQGQGDRLQSHLGTYQASMAAGMAVGAIGGGYIPAYMPHTDLFNPTSWNLLFVIALSIFHLLISPYLFSEGERIPPPEEHDGIKGQMKKAIKFSLASPVIRDLMILAATIGLTMGTLDTYWQIRLTEITIQPSYIAFGWITAGYFAMAIMGPMLISMISEALNISANVQVKVLPILLGVVLYVLATRANFGPFIAVYLTFMLVMSMIGPPSETLLNNAATDNIRSTMQSVSSFIMRVGGAISAFGFAYVIKILGVSTTWTIIAGIAIALGVLRIVMGLASSKTDT